MSRSSVPGPYGLSVSAHLRGLLRVRAFGAPMQTWRTRMPPDMRLRSDWHETSFSDARTAPRRSTAGRRTPASRARSPSRSRSSSAIRSGSATGTRETSTPRTSLRVERPQRSVPAHDRGKRGGRRHDAGRCGRGRAVRSRTRSLRRRDGRRRQVRDRAPGLRRLRVAPRRRRRRRPGRPRERAPRRPRRSRCADGRALEPALVHRPRAPHEPQRRSASASIDSHTRPSGTAPRP